MNREVILLLFPVVAGFCIPAGTLVSKNFGKLISLIACLAGIIYAVLLAPDLLIHSRSVIIGNWPPPFGINLFFSPLSLGAALLIYALAAFAILFDFQYSQPQKGQYYLLYCLFVTAAVGIVLTCDIFSLFIFLGLASLASSALIAAGREHKGPEGGLRYLIQAQGAGLIMLGGIALLYGATGALNIAVLARFEPLKPSLALLTGVLILLPIFLHMKLFPFHCWVAGAYNGATSSFAISLSGIMAPAGAVALGHLVLTMMNDESAFRTANEGLRILLLVIGAATVLIGETAAVREKNLKKVLAYSSMGQMGMIALGISAANFTSLKGVLLLILGHSLAKSLLFLASDLFIDKSGTLNWQGMKGIGRRLPLPGSFFAIGALSLIGIPLFTGFWGKLELIRGGFSSGGIHLVGTAAVICGTIIEAVYLVRIGLSFFKPVPSYGAGGDEQSDWSKTGYDLSFLLPALLLSAALMVIGIAPSLIESWLSMSIHELLYPQSGYVDIILN